MPPMMRAAKPRITQTPRKVIARPTQPTKPAVSAVFVSAPKAPTTSAPIAEKPRLLTAMPVVTAANPRISDLAGIQQIKAPTTAPTIAPTQIASLAGKNVQPIPASVLIADNQIAALAGTGIAPAVANTAAMMAQQSAQAAQTAAQAMQAPAEPQYQPQASQEGPSMQAPADDQPQEQAFTESADSPVGDHEARDFVMPSEEPAPMLEQELPADWEADVPWQEMQGFAGERADGMEVFAHVSNGKMCATGVCKTPFGIFPVVAMGRVDPSAPNGPVSAGEELPMSLNRPIAQSLKVLEMKASDKALKLAAESLVKRARARDQNAMAMLAMVGENARKGIPRAMQTAKAVEAYMHAHPADSPFGNDEPTVMHQSVVALANAAPLSNARLAAFSSTFGTVDEEELFEYAIHNHDDPSLSEGIPNDWAKKIAEFGQAVGKARAIQLVRLPQTPISVLGAHVGWEFGE